MCDNFVMTDKAFLISEAQKLLAKGQIDKAVAKWEEISKAFPEGNTFNFVGDLFLKKGDKAKAMETYHKAAKYYTDEGFSLKALALYKKILNINPQDAGSLIALGELNEAKKLIPDAIRYYLAAADSLFKDRRLDEVPKVYDRVIRLAPKNINLRVKIADKYMLEGFITEASREHYHVGNVYLENNDIENAAGHFKKAIEMRPTNRDAIYALSSIYIESGDTQRALAFNRTSIERLGEDPKLLVNTSKILISTGEFEEGSEMLSKVLGKDPSNFEAKLLLAELYAKAGERDKAWKEYKAVIDEYLRAGKTDEAIDLLKTHKEYDPEANRKKLANIYKHSGKEDLAVRELFELHDIFMAREEKDSALEALREAYELQPYNTLIKEKMDFIESQEAATKGPVDTWPSMGAECLTLDETARFNVSPTAEPEQPCDTNDEAPDQASFTEPAMGSWPAESPSEKTAAWPAMETVEGGTGFGPDDNAQPLSRETAEEPDDEPASIEDTLTEADVLMKYGKLDEARNRLESLKVQAPSNIDVHMRLKALYIETKDIEQAVTECLILSMLSSRMGFEDQRIDYLREAYTLNPADPRLEGRLDDIGPLPTSTEQPQTMQFDSQNQADEHELPETIDSDVMDIFDEFKRGLEKEIEAEDSETHYNLGIAYKEMGLIDDSIKEFQVAQRDPQFHVQAATMLGLCYMEKAVYPLAIEAFQNALSKTPAGDEGTWRLKYDLAEAYEKNGKLNESMRLYTDVYGWKADYRDVASKVSRQNASATPEPSDKPAQKRSRVSYI